MIFLKFLFLSALSPICFGQYQYLGGYNPSIYGKEEWKSVVVIEFDSAHVCSGSVIEKDFVVTAAHCVDRDFQNNMPFKHSNLTCRIGGFINELSDLVIPVDKVYYHPDYNLTAGIADIALLKLKFPVRRGVKYINLPTTQLSYGSHCHLVGWRDLEYDLNITKRIAPIVPLPKRTIYVSEQALMDISTCEEALREINYELYNEVMTAKNNIIAPTSLCTRSKIIDPSKFNDSVTDSGGPIICEDELFAVQSFMLEMKDDRRYYISTRVDKYIDWITSITKKEQKNRGSLPQVLTEEDLAKSNPGHKNKGSGSKNKASVMEGPIIVHNNRPVETHRDRDRDRDRDRSSELRMDDRNQDDDGEYARRTPDSLREGRTLKQLSDEDRDGSNSISVNFYTVLILFILVKIF